MSVLDHLTGWGANAGAVRGEQPDSLRVWPRLSFSSSSYERHFVQYYNEFYYRYAQASLTVGMLLIIGDYIVDLMAFQIAPANLYRIQFCLPILVVGIGYSFTDFAKRHWQSVMSAFIAAVAACLFWVLLVIDSQGGMGLRSWVGILNFVFLEFYCFVILGIQFRTALATGIIVLLMFEGAMLLE
jgi:hypothetical protein